MNSFLVKYVIDHIWCSPEQDYQHLFKPMRISPTRGALRYANVEWKKIPLPTKEDTYHIYQIGQLSSIYLNMVSDQSFWVNVMSLMNECKVMINLYSHLGLHYPRHHCFMMKTRSNNLLIAVREHPKVGNLRVDHLYARFYSNAYFRSTRSNDVEETFFIDGKTIEERRDILLIKDKMNHYVGLNREKVSIFHNGYLVDGIVPGNVSVGDSIEFVIDSSVYEKKDFAIKTLETFHSTKDELKKYLLSRLKGSTDSIDFYDDVDFWIIDKTVTPYKGIFYHKKDEKSVRMITHKDYALPVQNLVNQILGHMEWVSIHDLHIRLHIRKSGYQRALVKHHQRIRDLYRLTDDQVLRAMVGAQSLIPEWKASQLEASLYTQLMEASLEEITPERVQQTLGYNAISQLVADTPQYPIKVAGHSQIYPPFKLQSNSTFFEYDVKGRLVNFYYHPSGYTYYVRNEAIKYVQGIVGKGENSTSTTYNRACVVVGEDYDFKTYYSPIVDGKPTFEWVEGILDEDYGYHEGTVIWLKPLEDYFVAVRDERAFLAKTIHRPIKEGIIEFTLTAMDQLGDEVIELPVHLPMGKLELFLNGHPIIEGLDYFVQWPKVIICNKEFIEKDAEHQRITIRCTGFMLGIERPPPAEFGFIKHGLLSKNNRYDIRDDKVMRFIIDGRLWDKSELEFAENHDGVQITGVREGAPYLIDDIIVPMKSLIDTTTFEFREQSRQLDQRVSDYLTPRLPEALINDLSIIERRYELYSPFIAKIHHDLRTLSFYPEMITSHYSDDDIKLWVKEYEYLLAFDPCLHGVDDRYVVVHPHHLDTVTTLDIYQYTFLQRLSKVYLNNRVDLSYHVSIKEGWI